MKCRLRESRLIAINEAERSLTVADVSAVYQINGDETKHSARNRMLANSHAGRGTRLPPGSTQYKDVSRYLSGEPSQTNPALEAGEPPVSGFVLADNSPTTVSFVPQRRLCPMAG